VALLVAVVVGRGGDLARLAALDLAGALGADDASADPTLAVKDVRVSVRTTAGGARVVVVTGVVHNTGPTDRRGVDVEVVVGAQRARARAGSALDALAVGAAANIDALGALPRSPGVDPLVAGARAPFAVVLPASTDDDAVEVRATTESAS
jgi:hypothetical protein